MPFCQDESCHKTGLRKHEVAFDDELKKVLCRPCYQRRHQAIPVEVINCDVLSRHFDIGFHFTTDEGLQIEASYGDIEGEVRVPFEEIKRIFVK